MRGARDSSALPFPPPQLGEAILRVIAEVTGRHVYASQVSAWDGEGIEVVAMLDEAGDVEVHLLDPMQSGAV